MCGVAMTLGSRRKGWSTGSGSTANASMPAPAIALRSSASTNAASSTMGQLDGVADDPERAGDDDAEVVSRGDVDDGIARTGRDQQPQRGKTLEHRAGQRRALAHGDDDLEALQPLDERVLVCDVVGERHHV